MEETLPFPPQNYDQTSSYSLKNYDQSSSISLQNYDQGVQDFDFNRLFLLTGGSNLKTKMEEMFVFKSSLIPFRVILEWSSPLSVLAHANNISSSKTKVG